MSRPRIHLHVEQFDGAPHPVCGQGNKAVGADEFEATPTDRRCRRCEQYWFPTGQPELHAKRAREHFEQARTFPA